MSKVEKFIGEAKISEQPTKKLTWMINDNVVATNHIKDNAVTEPKISGEDSPNGPAVTTAKIADKAVTTPKIADGAVTTDKISGGLIDGVMTQPAVTTAKIDDGAVTSAKIFSGAVTGDKIASGAVHTENLGIGAVQSIHIAKDAVITEKIFPFAVSEDKIKNYNVTTDKISGSVDPVTGEWTTPPAITENKIAAGAVTATKIEDYDSTKDYPTGVTNDKIADNAVIAGNIAANAVENRNLADNSVTTAKILDGNVTTSKILDGNVTTAKLQDYDPNSDVPTGVTTNKIADYNVTEAKLADGAVTTDKLADGLISDVANITDAHPVEGSVKPIQSGGVQEALLDRVIMGDIVGDPVAAWEPGTAEAYIDQRINEQNNLVNTRMNRQDTVIDAVNGTVQSMQQAVETLNGNDVVIVDDHTQILEPEEKVIYRQPDTDSYTDWMWDTSQTPAAWAEIATYSFPGIDDEPTAGSENLVESGGVYKELDIVKADLQTELSAITLTEGAFIKQSENVLNINSPQSSDSWRYAIVDCVEGDCFVISGRTTSNAAPIWAFCDNAGNVVEMARNVTDLNQVAITAPAGATKLVLDDNLSGRISYSGKSVRKEIDDINDKIIELQDDVDGRIDAINDDIADVNTEIDSINGTIGEILIDTNTDLQVIAFTDGAFVKQSSGVLNINSPQSSSAWRYAIVSCQEGDKFFVSGKTTSNAAPIWAFCDDSGNVKSMASGVTDLDKAVVTAPAGATKLVLDDNNSGRVSYKGEPLYKRFDRIEPYTKVAQEADDVAHQNAVSLYKGIGSCLYAGDLGTENWQSVDNTAKVFVVPVTKGDVVSIKTRYNTATLLGFLKTFNTPVSGAAIDYAASRITLAANHEYSYTVAEGVSYMAIRYMANSSVCMPSSVNINGYEYIKGSAVEHINRLNDASQSSFYLDLLDYCYYIKNDGSVDTSSTPAWRGSVKMAVKMGEVYNVDAAYYMLYDCNMNNIGALKAIDGSIVIPEGAAYIAFNIVSTDEYVPVHVERVRRGYAQENLSLLEYGLYWSSASGQVIGSTSDPSGSDWRGTEKLAVVPGEYWMFLGLINDYTRPEGKRVPYYMFFNGDSVVTLSGHPGPLIKAPDNRIIKIPANVTHIVFEAVPVAADNAIIAVNLSKGSDPDHIQWRGRKWVAFGCSISDTGADDNGNTATGKYPQYLVGLSGLKHVNWAWGGSCLADREHTDTGNHPTYLMRIDAAVSGGALNGADIVTIDGLYNDWGEGVSIGNINDETDGAYNDSTIYMSLYQAISKIRAAAPNAAIVLITDSTGKDDSSHAGDFDHAHVNTHLYQKEYCDAMVEFAKYAGVVCIEAGKISQINKYTTQYLADHIHHSDLGGKQFANAIWSVLKDIMPNEV